MSLLHYVAQTRAHISKLLSEGRVGELEPALRAACNWKRVVGKVLDRVRAGLK